MSLISFVQEGHAFKIVCTIAEILCNCSPPLKISACKKREGYIIAAIEGLAWVSSAIVMSTSTGHLDLHRARINRTLDVFIGLADRTERFQELFPPPSKRFQKPHWGSDSVNDLLTQVSKYQSGNRNHLLVVCKNVVTGFVWSCDWFSTIQSIQVRVKAFSSCMIRDLELQGPRIIVLFLTTTYQHVGKYYLEIRSPCFIIYSLAQR